MSNTSPKITVIRTIIDSACIAAGITIATTTIVKMCQVEKLSQEINHTYTNVTSILKAYINNCKKDFTVICADESKYAREYEEDFQTNIIILEKSLNTLDTAYTNCYHISLKRIFKYYKDANNTIADLTAFKEKLTALSKMISTQWIDAVSNDKELYDYFNSYEISEYIYKNFK